MAGDLKPLKTIAALDAKIFELEARRKKIPNLILEKKESLDKTRELLAAKDAELRELRTKTAFKEKEFQAAEQAVIKFREQIVQAKSNKEFQALQHEILSKEADNARLEDAVLLQMQKVDKHAEERNAIAKGLKNDEARLAGECAALQKELQDIGKEIEKFRTERAGTEKDVPADIFAKYERLIARRGHTAMVAVVNGTCQGCFMNLRPETMAQLKKGDDLVFCHSCARILYLED